MSTRAIRPAQSLPYLGISGVNCLTVRWAPWHAYAINSTRVLETPHHPRYELSKRRWETRTDPFWWNCLVSTKIGGNKKVVRGWLMKRARVAITDALRRKGYAKNGSRLPEVSKEFGGEGLVGSANFMVAPEMLHTSFTDLQKQADLVIATMESRQRRKKNAVGRGRGSSKSPVEGGQNHRAVRLIAQ